MEQLKIGIIKEGKTPPDTRVLLNPAQCAEIIKQYPGIEIKVQQSANRCFSDAEYTARGITLVDDVSDCDLLLGVKEVPIDNLIADKTYFFFSHTFKAQPYNRGLLQAILQKNIQLVDYEVLTNEQGIRLIAFGRFAGIVGAHNGLMAYGNRTGAFQLGRVGSFKDQAALYNSYKTIKLPPVKIVLTGNGRVAKGAVETLEAMGIKQVGIEDYLSQTFEYPVYVQLDSDKLYHRKDGGAFEFSHFFQQPSEYACNFSRFYKATDIMINAIYWDPKAPAYFTLEEMQQTDFKITSIADITCDIAPESSLPSTLRASTIADPVYGFNPNTNTECEAYTDGMIDVMAVDNLPNELPRDASQAFGEQFSQYILPELFNLQNSPIIKRASIAVNGQLGKNFTYLKSYVEGV